MCLHRRRRSISCRAAALRSGVYLLPPASFPGELCERLAGPAPPLWGHGNCSRSCSRVGFRGERSATVPRTPDMGSYWRVRRCRGGEAAAGGGARQPPQQRHDGQAHQLQGVRAPPAALRPRSAAAPAGGGARPRGSGSGSRRAPTHSPGPFASARRPQGGLLCVVDVAP